MTELKEVYRCGICGNVVEVLHTGVGTLVCCGQPMTLMRENVVDAAQEKHVPVVEKTKDGMLVKIGSVPHPMEEKHHIEWIEVLGDGIVSRKFLKPGEKPEAAFSVQGTARAYCNLHGLWKS